VEVLALVAARRWKEADALFLTIYPLWQDDPRFAALSASIGLARSDLDYAEEWLSSSAETVPRRLRHPLVRRLWSGDIGPGLADELERKFPADWPDLVSTALSAELRFYVLLWQKRYAEARDYAARMTVLLRRMELPEAHWLERGGDAAFYDGEYIEARGRYEETLSLLSDPAPVYLKLSDTHFMLGGLDREALLSGEDLREPSSGVVTGMCLVHNTRVVKSFAVAITMGCAVGSLARAQEEVPPVDRRTTEPRHLDLPYTFDAPESREEWVARAAYLKKHILCSAGLCPEPPRGQLNARVFGLVDRGDHTVEKVYFESLPGFYVTGNLYRPKKTSGKSPGLLNTHGHWDWGRLERGVDASHPERAQSFAKLGFVTFSYDMVSYGDAVTFGESRGIEGHRSVGWGDRESLWGLSLMGLQLWNSLRAVDFLVSLPDVDLGRIGITGESGGGTQTFLLTAVDSRITASSPVNMISAHMQGGCACENAPNLRVDTNNMEIGVLAAPRPLLLIAATGDWTKDTLTLEFPAIRSVYRLLGAATGGGAPARRREPHRLSRSVWCGSGARAVRRDPAANRSDRLSGPALRGSQCNGRAFLPIPSGQGGPGRSGTLVAARCGS